MRSINIPKIGKVNFPDTMSDDDIVRAIENDIIPNYKPPPPSGVLRRVGDVGLSFLKGAVGLPEFAVGLADIPTLGRAGKAAEDLGFRFKEAKEIIQGYKSPEQQAAERAVSEAEGFVPTVVTALQNPSSIIGTIAESLPSMLGGAGIARGLGAIGAKALGAEAIAAGANGPALPGLLARIVGEKAAPRVAAGLGEGAVSMGSGLEQARQESESGFVSPLQIGTSAVSGALTAGFGIFGGKMSEKLHVSDIDTLLARGVGKAEKVLNEEKKNIFIAAAKSALTESVFEELPQSMQEQIATNLNTGKPWDQGVVEAGAMGALAAIGMGGVGGAIGQYHQNRYIDSLPTPEEREAREKELEEARALFKEAADRKQTYDRLGIPNPDIKLLPDLSKQVEPKNPLDELKKPVGAFGPDILGQAAHDYANEVLQKRGLPKVDLFSINDLANASAPQSIIDTALTATSGFNDKTKTTAEDVLKLAESKNVQTDTPGWNDFLKQATGTTDINKMSGPQLHSAYQTLNRITPVEASEPIPSGKVNYTQEQQTAQDLLDRLDSGKKVTNKVVAETVTSLGLTPSNKVNENLSQLRDELTKAQTPATNINTPDIRKGTFELGEEPVATSFAFMDSSGNEIRERVSTEQDATETVDRLNAYREAEIARLQKEADTRQQKIDKNSNTLERETALGRGNTPEFIAAKTNIETNNEKLAAKRDELLQKIEPLKAPITVKPTDFQAPSKSGYTLFENGKALATFATPEQAQEHAVSRMTDEQLNQIVAAPTQKGLRNRHFVTVAKNELDDRVARGVKAQTGIRITTQSDKTSEQVERELADLGIQTQRYRDLQEQADEIAAKLLPLMRRFGLEDLNLDLVSVIKNPEGHLADGKFEAVKRLISVALDADNPIRVLRHEGIHALRQLGAFTDDQWRVLSNKAKSDWIAKYKIAERYKGMPLEDQIEEAIADAFSDFDMSRPQPGMVGALFNKIKQFLAALGSALQGNGFTTAESIFGKIEQGQMRDREGEVGEGETKFSKVRDAVPGEREIPTQYPTGKTRIYNPATDMLSIDEAAVMEAMEKSPEMRAKVIKALRNYGFMPLGISDKEVIPLFKRNIINNLIYLYNLVPADTRERSKLWYVGAHKIAGDLSKQTGLTLEQVSGIFAALSPQKDWFQNVSMGERTINILQERGEETWTPEVLQYLDSYVEAAENRKEKEKREQENEAARKMAKLGTKLKDMTAKEAAAFIRAYDEAYNSREYNIVTPEGGFSGLVTKNDGSPATMMWGGYGPIAKAVEIYRDGDRENISKQLGTEHKVRSFYDNIAAPESKIPHVTIDTHAMAAALFQALAGTDQAVKDNFGSTGSSSLVGVSGIYGIVADAYREAAAQVGVSPREMQSITWEAIRGLFEADVKKNIKGPINKEWAKYKAGEQSFDEARENIVAIGGGITEPQWKSSDTGKTVAKGGSSYDKSFKPEGGVRLREAKTVREKFEINLTNATESIPGLKELYKRANAGDVKAHELIQKTAESHLRYLLSGTKARISVSPVVGVYKSNREPSINLIVTFNEQEKQEVLAALSRFGINYKQSEIHVRQPTAYKIGYIYPDGSYVTTTFDIPLKAELTETQIKEIVQDTEVIGFSTTPTTLTTYWVRTNDDKTDAENFNEFRERVGRVHELVGDPSLTIGKRTQRLSVFGGDEDEESNAIASYKDIGGDVRPKKASDTETARLIAEYVSGGPIKVFTQKPLSRKIENQQILMAQVNEEVPINDLKKALVRKCYQALAKVLKAQFAVLPIKVELTVPPKRKKIYSNSAAMRRDVSENNTLKIFATTPDSFGPEGSDFSDHPLLQPSGFKDINKKPLLYNDLLRAVHDYFAHNVSPAEFGPAGEYAAWANHMGSISDPYARWALTAETRMQNAWQNFREGVEGVSLDDRGFSLQKAALPPISLTYTGDEVVDAPMRELENSLTDVQKLGSIKPTSLLRKAALEGKAPSKEVPIPKLVPKFSLRAPNTPKFKRFFGDSKIVDENNQPRVMYHGTARDITTFKGKQANAIFLTDSPSFAEDFSRMSEDWMIDHRYDFFTDDQLNDFKKQADAIANKTGNYADDELRKLLLENLPSNANIMPLYVRAENPFDYDDPAQVTALLDQLRENGVDVTTRDRGASIQEGLKVGRWHEVEKPEVQEAIKQLGHDAFYVKEGGIKNLAVYDPSQVKSATGNTGEFSRDNPDIRYSLREELENNADEIAAMDKDVRENTKYQDLPGGYPAYTLYEARKVMPKKESTIKRVTYSNTDILYQYSDGVANVDGNPYLVTKQENPDFDPYDRGSDEDAQTSVDEDGIRQSRYVWAFEDPADPNFKQYETAFFDIPSAIEEFKQHLSSVPKYSMRGATVTPKNVPFVLRDSTILDNFMYSVQDNLYDLKTALDEIKKMGIAIKDSVNPYEKEQLFHNRAAYQNEHFINHELKPLLQKLAAFNISTEKLEEYLHARHAETRNKAMAAINPGQPDGLSGMTTAEAKKILANYTPNQLIKLQNLGRMVDSIMKKTREVMVAGGLETQQTIDNWDAKYPDYVPLYREDVDLYNGGQGAGFSIAGATSKRAIGSTKGVKNILANIVMQRERVIGRAERNRVSNSMYGLAIDVPNADFWMAVDPDMKRTPQSQAILEAQLVNMGLTPADAAAVFAPPKKRAIDNKTGLVTFVRDFNLAKNNNVLVTRVNGKDKYVIFNPKDARALRLVGALKNLDAEQMGAVMSNIAKLTRYFASMQTQYNPAFGLFNFLRDIQGAMLNLSTTPLRGKGRRILSQSLPAMLGIYNDLRNERKGIPSRSKWSQIYEEFGSEGGPTGFRDMFLDADSRAKAIQSELSAINDGTVKQIGKGIFNWLSDFNSAVENSIRLVAYSEAIDMGMSKQKAAVLAKNITVNFNKSGAKTQEARALYAFFNASVQGTTKVAETLRGPMGRRIVFGGMLIGMMQAMLLAASGFEDDEPPDEIKDKSLIIPTGDGTYKAIPMPQGFNVIPGFARRIFELAMSDDPNVGKALISMTGMFANAFNPIGNAGLSIQTIAPTVVDPFVALAENKDFNGRPISRLDFDSRDPTPGFTRAKDNASAVGSAVSEMVNFLSGGDKYTQGAISPTPDAIDYLIGQAFGGVGKEGTKLMSLASSIQDNEELPSYKIPMVGRFFGNLNEASAVQARFYENIKQMNKHQREIEGREQDELDTDWYYAKFPEAALYSEADSIARDVSNLRKQVREMKQTGESPEDIKGLNEEIVSRMNELNEAIKEERANRQ